MKETIDKLLSEWTLTTEDESVARTHASLVAAFEGIRPEEQGQDSLDLLLAEELVKVTSSGDYVLTQKGCKKRKSLGGSRLVPAKPKNGVQPTDPREWERFKKLLIYYEDCIRKQCPGKDYLYDSDNGIKYLVPNLGYNWLVPPDQDCPANTINIGAHDKLAQGYLHSVSPDQKLYIGYPIEAFEYNGKTLYTPIGLIPVDIVGGTMTTMDLQLYHRDASLNPYWLDFNIPRQTKTRIYNAIINIHKGDKYYGTIDLYSAMVLFTQYSRSKTPLDQNRVDFILPSMKKGESKLCNTPILFAAQSSTYTKTLLRELEQIRKTPASVLDKTALAYVFREHALQFVPSTEHVSIPFISCNDEQRQAVTEAINKPITRVTGPPGTGKSQVAVNIISNLVCRGKRVLFTSKNHKAVHAIADRSMQVSEHLVKFCSTPDGKTSKFWYEWDIDALYAKVKANYLRENTESARMLRLAEDRILGIEKSFAERNNIINEIKDSFSDKEAVEKLLEQHIEGHSQPTEASVRELKRHIALMKDKPVWKRTLASFFECFFWRLQDRQLSEESTAWLRSHYPTLFQNANDIPKVKQLLNAYIVEAERYLQRVSRCQEALQKAKSLPPITEQEVNNLGKQLNVFEQERNGALAHALLHPLVAKGDNSVQFKQMKNIMKRFEHSNGHYNTEQLTQTERETAEAGVREFLNCVPAWASTMLSLTKASPCIAGIFDHVIIDEASQCDIPPMIPALFRAKSATIIGDPQQFPPVRSMQKSIHDYLMRRHEITGDDMRFNYLGNSAYDIPEEKPVFLRDHYRCHSDIAAFSNEEYYDGNLNICTNERELANPDAFGLSRAYEWLDIQGGNQSELDAIEQHLQKLVDSGYQGSVGVITPFRRIADRMAERFQKFEGKLKDFLVNTANGFQGGERDLIIFNPAYTASLSNGLKWYAESEENRYIYNVAVSRARACLLVVGDRERCRNSGVKVLQALAEHPKPKSGHARNFDSVWEEKLYNALKKVGVSTLPQFRVANRRLDLAYKDANIKLDIEVDGVRYHASAEYGRKADDIYRDLQMRSLGWEVQRFWVYELEQNMDACVQKVKDAILTASTPNTHK